MAFDLALFDLVSPYVLLGDSFGPWHAALSVIYIEEHSIALDDAGVVIRGVARFSGEARAFIDPSTMSFGVMPKTRRGIRRTIPDGATRGSTSATRTSISN